MFHIRVNQWLCLETEEYQNPLFYKILREFWVNMDFGVSMKWKATKQVTKVK